MNGWFKQHGGTLLNLAKIWFVLFGQFGGASIRTYIKKVADEYMSTKRIKYVANENLNGFAGKEKMGCYEDLVSHTKTLIVLASISNFVLCSLIVQPCLVLLL